MLEWTKVYSLVDEGVIRKNNEYLVKDGGYDCYKVKTSRGIIYSSKNNFTTVNPVKNYIDFDEDLEEYGVDYDD
jgi:hypothetical protein